MIKQYGATLWYFITHKERQNPEFVFRFVIGPEFIKKIIQDNRGSQEKKCRCPESAAFTDIADDKKNYN